MSKESKHFLDFIEFIIFCVFLAIMAFISLKNAYFLVGLVLGLLSFFCGGVAYMSWKEYFKD